MTTPLPPTSPPEPTPAVDSVPIAAPESAAPAAGTWPDQQSSERAGEPPTRYATSAALPGFSTALPDASARLPEPDYPAAQPGVTTALPPPGATDTFQRAQPMVIAPPPIPERATVAELLAEPAEPELHPVAEAETLSRGGLWLALLRIALGLVFLWSFADRTFGLGWRTVRDQAWLQGHSPTAGFLSNSVNPKSPLGNWLATLAGQTWVDWVFQLGLLGIGLALVLGVGLRIAAVCGVALCILLYLATWPLVQVVEVDGTRLSTNPLIDVHVIYALLLIVLARFGVRSKFGLGALCRKLPAFLH